MTTLYLVRHGNTFSPGETPRRVGARTDLPLSPSGQQQANWLGQYLKQQRVQLHAVFTSELQRTLQTAYRILAILHSPLQPIVQSIFNEIDYGPDENKTEAEVIQRIGKQALRDWNEKAIIPQGWQADPSEILRNWFSFAEKIVHDYPNQTILVVTSNGIARFAPYLADADPPPTSLTMHTGAISCLHYGMGTWQLVYWNQQPKIAD